MDLPPWKGYGKSLKNNKTKHTDMSYKKTSLMRLVVNMANGHILESYPV